MCLHDLRHGAASLLVGAGTHPRVAQELLRHASSKTTMEIYAHVSGLSSARPPTYSNGSLGNRSPNQSPTPPLALPRVGLRSLEWAFHEAKLAPAVGLEPTTKRLTAARSTTELRRSEDRRGAIARPSRPRTGRIAKSRSSRPRT